MPESPAGGWRSELLGVIRYPTEAKPVFARGSIFVRSQVSQFSRTHGPRRSINVATGKQRRPGDSREP